MAAIIDIVKTFVSQDSFRSHWEFPSQQRLLEMKSIILRNNKDTLASKCTISKIRKSFRIVLDSNVEWIMTKENKKILSQEGFAEEFKKAHDNAGHPGRSVAINKMKAIWHCVPNRLVWNCIDKCQNCCSRKPIAKPIAGRPIYSSGTMDRLQIDLINMRSHSDGNYKWIVHAKDHFSKFTWAQPLENKTCVLVTQFLRKIFFTFGPSKIVQCDNGGEFTGSDLPKFLEEHFLFVKIIHSRPRHPQSNGLIERANGTLESRISAYMIDHGQNWASYLDVLIFEINTSISRTIKMTPYELLFARKSRNDIPTLELSNHVSETSDSDSEIEEVENTESLQPTTAVGEADETDAEIEEFVDTESCQPTITISEADETEDDPEFKPWVLYDKEPPYSWAIAKLVSESKTSRSFELKMILCSEACNLNDNRQLIEGETLTWPKNLTTDSLGETLQSIMTRIPSWNSYLQNRRDQGDKYVKKLKKHRFELGDLVSLPIPKVDRSNTCPRNLPCKIINSSEIGILTLQCAAGVIEKGFHEDKVGPWLAEELYTTNWPETLISVIKAYRSVTAYSTVNL